MKKVQEFPWAFLVSGTSSVDEARKLLARKLPGGKRKRAMRMPCRPLVRDGVPCVAFYFSIGPGAEQKYKP